MHILSIQKIHPRILPSLACAALLFAGCLDLDPFLWKAKPVNEYTLDNNTGDAECKDAIDSLVKWYGPLDTTTVHEISFACQGETVSAIFLSGADVLTSADTLIFYIYGRTWNIDFYWPRTRLLAATGFPVFVMDFPGYGKSTGETTEDGVYAAGRAAMEYIRLNLGDPRVAMYGYSTGTWTACELASSDVDGQIISLVCEAPYNSVETLVQDALYLDMPGSYLTSLDGNCAEKIKNVYVQFLWIYGTQDQTLNPETHGQQVWDNYPGDTAFYIAVLGADHTEVPSTIGYRRYIDCIASFIRGKPEDNLFIQK